MDYHCICARADHAAKLLLAPLLAFSLLVGCSQPGAGAPPVGEPPASEGMEDQAPVATDASEVATAAVDTGVVTDPSAMADVTITVATSAGYGDYLVGTDEMALYLFEEDMTEVSTCTGGCSDNWPPAIVTGAVMSGEGVDAALLGTSTRDDGSMHLTYNGRPLYYYAEDVAPEDVNGHAQGDVWYLVSPAGEKIMVLEPID